jgi:hypothetical protein
MPIAVFPGVSLTAVQFVLLTNVVSQEPITVLTQNINANLHDIPQAALTLVIAFEPLSDMRYTSQQNAYPL